VIVVERRTFLLGGPASSNREQLAEACDGIYKVLYLYTG